MSRIGTLGASSSYLNQLMAIQQRINTEQTRISSGLKSLDYSGIATDANSLVNFQNEKAKSTQYATNNIIASTRLSVASTSINSVQTTIKNFRDQLSTFSSSQGRTQQNVEQIQSFAFQAMTNMQSYLSTNVDGQYIFGGARTSTLPVQLGFTSLSQFQSTYDGDTIKYPTTRSADLQKLDLTKKEMTSLSVDSTTGVVTAGQSNGLTSVTSSSLVDLSGLNANNGSFTVQAHALTNVAGQALAEGTTPANAATQIAFGSTPTNLTAAAALPGTGALTFGFSADGLMTMTPANVTALSSTLTLGSTFTLNNTAGKAWDGAFKVVSIDSTTGAIKFSTNTDTATNETVAAGALSISHNGAAAGPSTGQITTSTAVVGGLTQVTLTSSAAAEFGAGYAAGDTVTLGGSQYHNGTYTVVSSTPDTVTFALNPDGIRLSKFVPQTGRTDSVLSYTDSNGVTTSFDSTNYGSLSFSPTGTVGERITATTPNAFNVAGVPNPAVGTVISLKSTTGVNDGTYQVVANNGGNIEIKSTMLAAGDTNVASARIDSSTWYHGDTLELKQHISSDRTVDVGIYASDPAFEKAFRAMSIIAQGAFGTSGGLDKNLDRLGQALYLLNDSLQSPTPGTPPFGPESRSDINTLQSNLGFTASVITQATTDHKQYAAFLDQRISDLSQADKTETITMMLSDSNALQASYQSLAKVQSLSLINFLK